MQKKQDALGGHVESAAELGGHGEWAAELAAYGDGVAEFEGHGERSRRVWRTWRRSSRF